MQIREPPGYTVGAADLVAQSGATLVWEHFQPRTADPQETHAEATIPRLLLVGMMWAAMIACRPGCGRQDRVREDGTGGASDQGGMSGGNAAQTLTEPPQRS